MIAVIGLPAFSGILLGLAMPGRDVPFLGWIALVPVLAVLLQVPMRHVFPTALPFGLAFAAIAQSWYLGVFGPLAGAGLILAAGAFHASVLTIGVWLTRSLARPWNALALPVAWAAIEFLRFTLPVTGSWWFVLLAKSQWRFPPALQVLPVTGFPGLSLLVMGVNLGLALLLLAALRQPGPPRPGPAAGLALVAAGALTIAVGAAVLRGTEAGDPVRIAVLTDDANAVADAPPGPALFERSAALTRSVAAQSPDIVVWSENEFADADDPETAARLGALARETGAYLAVEMMWQAPSGLHEAAVLIAPDGTEALRRGKINITNGEAASGLVPGPQTFEVVETPFGPVSAAICWDVHKPGIMRALARAGAGLILLPMDSDFARDPVFPVLHTSDAVFRAAGLGVAFGIGSTNGLSAVIDPRGRITAEGPVNGIAATVGTTPLGTGATPHARTGDAFGWGLALALLGLVAAALRRQHLRR